MTIGTTIENLEHNPVMLNEMLNMLNVFDDGTYLDCTFGAGGFSQAILKSAKCNVIALDQDPSVEVKFAQTLKQNYNNYFQFYQTNFNKITNVISDVEFDGIVMDLGVSSMQLDEAERGFSFMRYGPLDMRMSNEGKSAYDLINFASETEIANIIYDYGDEPASRRIAKKIVTERAKNLIDNTLTFATIVREAIGHRNGKIDPATKTFQAIRIHINQELRVLEDFLKYVDKILKINGRLVIISFHSLEDRIIKNFFKKHTDKKVAISKYTKTTHNINNQELKFKMINKKPLIPTLEEIKANIRSRSAKLRAGIKIGGLYANQIP